jgi:hypothetical protein
MSVRIFSIGRGVGGALAISIVVKHYDVQRFRVANENGCAVWRIA